MKTKNQKIFESFDVSLIDKGQIDKKIFDKILNEIVTTSINLTDDNLNANAEINRLAQIIPTNFEK